MGLVRVAPASYRDIADTAGHVRSAKSRKGHDLGTVIRDRDTGPQLVLACVLGHKLNDAGNTPTGTRTKAALI